MSKQLIKLAQWAIGTQYEKYADYEHPIYQCDKTLPFAICRMAWLAGFKEFAYTYTRGIQSPNDLPYYDDLFSL